MIEALVNSLFLGLYCERLTLLGLFLQHTMASLKSSTETLKYLIDTMGTGKSRNMNRAGIDMRPVAQHEELHR